MSTRVALALVVLLGACGDPLTEGDWLGTPDLIVRGTTEALTPVAERELVLALVWTNAGGELGAFPSEPAVVDDDTDFGVFELALYDEPALAVPDDGIAIAMFSVLALRRGEPVPDALDGAQLNDVVRGVADEHYLLYVPDASAWQDRDDVVLNPISLRDGYNLAVGVCRPGRPSQLLVVPSERVSLVAVDGAERGQCLDVFWGAWRPPDR